MMLGFELDSPLSPDEARLLIDSVARTIVGRRLETPASLFLEMHKPLSFMASQGLACSLPLVGPFVGVERLARLSRLLRDRSSIDALLARIEELALDRDQRVSRPTAEEAGFSDG